ncbi:MAG: hypothetical protein CFE23_01195 [Flavobacterium sp. BFFFF1]|uniref:hypothetical protein n=1 Tax=Flavobacterium sp. BFFFF1 TaxID=2015557 RepID=UPI000BC4F5F5|nr:hypothetical protein [Flavobacterium sp. BFFFF1]OYU81950.1 MAG: hypothetical protein CFE23_01195 [Flavobacterium sp. BFFFF1]
MNKKIILILFLAVLFQACSSNKPIEVFLKTEITANKEKGVKSLLFDKKKNNQDVLNIYAGKNLPKLSSKAASFLQKDYNYLMKIYWNDTTSLYWNEKKRKEFSFSELVLTKDWMRKMLPEKDTIKYLYNVSAPLFNKNKKLVIFSISISSPPIVPVAEYLVIMKKEKRRWVLVEKVYDGGVY